MPLTSRFVFSIAVCGWNIFQAGVPVPRVTASTSTNEDAVKQLTGFDQVVWLTPSSILLSLLVELGGGGGGERRTW